MAKEADKEEIREETHEFQDSEQEELEEEDEEEEEKEEEVWQNELMGFSHVNEMSPIDIIFANWQLAQ